MSDDERNTILDEYQEMAKNLNFTGRTQTTRGRRPRGRPRKQVNLTQRVVKNGEAPIRPKTRGTGYVRILSRGQGGNRIQNQRFVVNHTDRIDQVRPSGALMDQDARQMDSQRFVATQSDRIDQVRPSGALMDQDGHFYYREEDSFVDPGQQYHDGTDIVGTEIVYSLENSNSGNYSSSGCPVYYEEVVENPIDDVQIISENQINGNQVEYMEEVIVEQKEMKKLPSDKWTEFIEKLSNFPCLYDLSDPKYSDIHIKSKKWILLTAQMSPSMEYNVQSVKETFRYLRDHYKKIKKSMGHTGSGSTSVKWTWFEPMRKLLTTSSNQSTRYSGGRTTTSKVVIISPEAPVIPPTPPPTPPVQAVDTTLLSLPEKAIVLDSGRRQLGKRRSSVDQQTRFQEGLLEFLHSTKKDDKEPVEDDESATWLNWFKCCLAKVDPNKLDVAREEIIEVTKKHRNV